MAARILTCAALSWHGNPNCRGEVYVVIYLLVRSGGREKFNRMYTSNSSVCLYSWQFKSVFNLSSGWVFFLIMFCSHF